MKILCEVALKVKQYDQSQYHWLKGSENFLFSFEEKKRLRMFSIKQGAAHEVQSASLADTRNCTYLSWNKDESLLAIVVDKRQIYIWEVRRNNFTQFKPKSMISGPTNQMAGNNLVQRKANKSIELVAWSKLSNKLAICYASGQILLCELATSNTINQDEQSQSGFTSVWERFIDNSESVLKQIVSIEVSNQAEIFACFSAISEILVMSFGGQTQFYSQGDRANLYNAKFSPLKREHCPRTGQYLGQTICLAYQSENDALLTKRIALDMDEFHNSPPVLHVLHDDTGHKQQQQQQQHEHTPGGPGVTLIDFFWLSPTRLLLCFSSGSIKMIQLDPSSSRLSSTGSLIKDPILFTELLRIDPCISNRSLELSPDGSNSDARSSPATAAAAGTSVVMHHQQQQDDPSAFRIFEMTEAPRRQDGSQSFALAAGTSYRLYYYELLYDMRTQSEFTFEHFDDLDLGESLQRVDLRLERARWSHDCSMLSLQLTSGHLLVYRTRLQDYMVASHGPRTVYLSSPNEVTILNYGLSLAEQHADGIETMSQLSNSSNATQQQQGRSDNALILNIQLRPSVLAIGSQHFALALNNRIRFYSLKSLQSYELNEPNGKFFYEREYAAIVMAIGLSSRFVAVQFDDGRLKLHSIKRISSQGDMDDDNDDDDNERFFPNPSQPQRISAFTITEQLLVYCTQECQVTIFCLKSWKIAQVCVHSKLFVNPIWKIKSNARGNKFVCLTEPRRPDRVNQSGKRRQGATNESANAFLYDLYFNNVYPIVAPISSNNDQSTTSRPGALWSKVMARQIELTCAILPLSELSIHKLLQETDLNTRLPVGKKKNQHMTNVSDAIWDTDGRSVLLIEAKSIHALGVLDHTLEQEEPIVEYAASARKPSSYTTLYVSQGIVSYQTSLGRVINSILETHDDELKLTKLELQINAIKMRCRRASTTSETTSQIERVDEETASDLQSQCEDGLLEAQLEIMFLKVNYLCTLLPIYPLPKCRDICKHLMEDRAFNLETTSTPSKAANRRENVLITQLIWKLLGAWSLLMLNLDFASLIYRRNNLHVQSRMLGNLLADIKGGRSNVARITTKERILALLGCKEL